MRATQCSPMEKFFQRSQYGKEKKKKGGFVYASEELGLCSHSSGMLLAQEATLHGPRESGTKSNKPAGTIKEDTTKGDVNEP